MSRFHHRTTPACVLAVALAIGCGGSQDPTPPATPFELATIATGAGDTCGLTAAGTAWCWGVGGSGRLGVGPGLAGDQIVPTRVAGGLAFTSISPGDVSTCAIASDGRAFCWGQDSGALGTGATPPDAAVVTPAPVGGTLRFKSIASGNRHACAIELSGDAYCWGSDYASATGSVPTLVADGRKYTSVVASGNRVCALGVDEKPYCWGGLVTAAEGPATDRAFVSLSMGAGEGCGLTSGHEIYCWDLLPDPAPAQTHLVAGGPWASLRQGVNAACAVTTAGEGFCWGNNEFGKLGNGLSASIYYPDPTPIVGGLHFLAVAPGQNHACGVTTNHATYCWGLASSGLLGIGTIPSFPRPYDEYSPVPVMTP